MRNWDHSVDVLVVGSGVGGMTAALTSVETGCEDVLLVEKGAEFGGTSALAGGVIWIPCNRYAREAGQQDSLEDAHEYLRRTIPDDIRRDDMIEAYLKAGPEMVDFLHEKSHARFTSLSMYPDYHSHLPGARIGNRALEPVPFNSALLGKSNDLVSHSHPIWYVLGRIPLSLAEINAVTVQLKGWKFSLLKRVLTYITDLPWRMRSRYDRTRKVGSAGVSRLFLTLKERGVPMWLNAPMTELIEDRGRIAGAVINRDGRRLYVEARKGVILASGGFEHNQDLRDKYLPKPTSKEWSTGVRTNTGDALKQGLKQGAAIDLMNKAWWCMTCQVPGEEQPRLMIIEKSLPGSCLVNCDGKRFVNESQNYMTMQDRLYEAHSEASPCAPAWLVFDARVRRKYIVGPLLTAASRPDWTLPRSWFDQGFMAKATSLSALAAKIGVNAQNLEQTIAQLNRYAATGKDLDFQRGETVYDRYYGDPDITPNPNLAPIVEAPFYALKLNPGDIGTQGGLVTDIHGRVLRPDGEPIPGLYASGNCTAAILPTYPGPGATLGPAMVFAYLAAKHITGFAAKNTASRDSAQTLSGEKQT